jgi:hypothetical protein
MAADRSRSGGSAVTILSHVDSISYESIVGWAVDSERPDEALDIVIMVQGQEHGRCRASNLRPGLAAALGLGSNGFHEFRYEFLPPLGVHQEWSVVVLAAGPSEPLVNGRRTLHGVTRRRPGLMPVMLTSPGRVGSTWLMSQFVDHPEIVLGDNFPFEIKYASYYAVAYYVLTSRATTDNPDFAEEAMSRLLIGGNPWHHPDYHRVVGGNHLEWFFNDSVPTRIMDLFRSLVLDAYGIIAVDRGKPAARWFVEKTSLADAVRLGIRGMFGEVREIVLVRDPRDYLCSARTFWNLATPAVLESMDVLMPALEAIHAADGADVIFMRYEDMVQAPVEALRRLHAFIGATAAVAVRPAERADWFQSHATSSSPAASVGRWRTDLAADEIAACESRYQSYMNRFGYEPDE